MTRTIPDTIVNNKKHDTNKANSLMVLIVEVFINLFFKVKLNITNTW
jgi:hypothetical protein